MTPHAAVLLMLAAAGVGVLAAVMWFGSTRTIRMRSFVEGSGGDWTPYDEFDLQPELDAIFGAGEWWVGVSGRLEVDFGGGASVYLVDLHPEPEGAPRRTALLIVPAEGAFGASGAVWERLPDAESDEPPTFDFEETGEETFTDPVSARLEKCPADREWLIEVRTDGSTILVGSRDRPLSSQPEWRELLDAARRLVDDPE